MHVLVVPSWYPTEEAPLQGIYFAEQAQLLRNDGLATPTAITIHPNPVRTEFFTLPPKERPSPPPFRFVTVVGLNAQKNLRPLLDAFDRAFGDSASVSLYLSGFERP